MKSIVTIDEIKAPIEILSDENYPLIIRDADGIYHFFLEDKSITKQTHNAYLFYDGYDKDGKCEKKETK